MKKWYVVIAALVVISFAAAAVLIPMMPDEVPMHYNISGEVDRMGSRYENLVFPALTAVMAASMVILARRRKGSSDEKALLIVGAASTALFVVMGIFFSVLALNKAPVAVPADTYRMILLLFGIFLLITGNIMPKVRMNSTFGLRTPWSMKNAETWRKSQRFGGISAVVCGAIMLLSAIFAEGMAAIIILLALVILWSAVCIYMSYRYAR